MKVSNEEFNTIFNEHHANMNSILSKYRRYLTEDEILSIKQYAVFKAMTSPIKAKSGKYKDTDYPVGLVIARLTKWYACSVIKNNSKYSSRFKSIEGVDYQNPKICDTRSIVELAAEYEPDGKYNGIMAKRFVDGKTLTEIAKDYDCSAQTISSTIKKVIKKCM